MARYESIMGGQAEMPNMLCSIIHDALLAARNEALEEALREIAMTTLVNVEDASADFMDALAHAQQRVASIKTKD